MNIDGWHFEEEDIALQELVYQERLDKIHDDLEFEAWCEWISQTKQDCICADEYECWKHNKREFFDSWVSQLSEPIWTAMGLSCREEMCERMVYGT